MLRAFGSTALLGCTALFITTVQAAERTGGRVEEVVVTGTREAEQLRDFVGSISLVKGDDVTVVGSTHHSEIMNRAPGTMIQRNSGEESLTAIRSPVLSGPGSCGTFLFLENSVPIRPTGFCNVNELFEVNSEQASSIEVLRGPAGALQAPRNSSRGNSSVEGRTIHRPETPSRGANCVTTRVASCPTRKR